jgi:hypothetical protein
MDLRRRDLGAMLRVASRTVLSDTAGDDEAGDGQSENQRYRCDLSRPQGPPSVCRTIFVPRGGRRKAGSGYPPPTDWAAMLWQFRSAESIVNLPLITADNSSVHSLPTAWNWGMPTY